MLFLMNGIAPDKNDLQLILISHKYFRHVAEGYLVRSPSLSLGDGGNRTKRVFFSNAIFPNLIFKLNAKSENIKIMKANFSATGIRFYAIKPEFLRISVSKNQSLQISKLWRWPCFSRLFMHIQIFRHRLGWSFNAECTLGKPIP